MSVSYTEVPTAQEVLPSAGQVQGTGVRFNGEGGVRKEWWWQAGPVDSCCFCCSLRAGVAILATIDLLLNGIYGTFYQQGESEKMFHDLLAQLKTQYSRMCSGTAAASLDCMRLAHTIEQLEDEIDLFNHLPITFYIQGVIAILAGVAGLVAVFNSSALAAKWYLWTWAPRCLAMVVTQVVLYAKQGKYGIDRNPAVFALSQIFSLVLTVYYIKVVWSYSKRLGYRGSNPSSSASQAVQIGQPSAGYDGV